MEGSRLWATRQTKPYTSRSKRNVPKLATCMSERGYDPVNQIVGYLISGDPTYITSYNNARYLIRMLERDELLEELVKYYVESHGPTIS